MVPVGPRNADPRCSARIRKPLSVTALPVRTKLEARCGLNLPTQAFVRLFPMLWPILLKTYAAAAVLYLAVTVGYVAWRLWLRKKAPQTGGEEHT